MSKHLALMAAILITPTPLPAAGPEIKSTTKITVSAPHLVGAFEIADEATLTLSHVFAGQFLDVIAPTPDPLLRRYTLTFDIQTLAGVKEAAYVVQYCIDDETGDGFIYLPGRDEPEYRRNVSTILREGQDGFWHRASREWNAAMARHVRQ